jgi:ubiquinone/menaquinone biosynthesis C-methylase UbiE
MNMADKRRRLTIEQARTHWDEHAPRFDREMGFYERILFGGARAWACSRVAGEVLELGIGTGRNLRFYPTDTKLTGVELSSKMLEIAQSRKASTMPAADLRIGDAQALEFGDATFDTVISTFSLCSIPDDAAAVREVKRVLKPGGRVVLVEHVKSPSRVIAAIQRMLEPIARRQCDSVLREPLNHLRREGFEIEVLERTKWGIVERVQARKPE